VRNWENSFGASFVKGEGTFIPELYVCIFPSSQFPIFSTSLIESMAVFSDNDLLLLKKEIAP
jgi:hypothetical protein